MTLQELIESLIEMQEAFEGQDPKVCVENRSQRSRYQLDYVTASDDEKEIVIIIH